MVQSWFPQPRRYVSGSKDALQRIITSNDPRAALTCSLLSVATPAVSFQTAQATLPEALKYDKLLTHFSSWTAEARTWSEQLPLPPSFQLLVSRLFWEMRKAWEGKWSIPLKTGSARMRFSINSLDLLLQLPLPKKESTLETERWAGGQQAPSAKTVFLPALLVWKRSFKWGPGSVCCFSWSRTLSVLILLLLPRLCL